MNEFKNLTLVVLASTELDSLKQTIRLLLENCAAEDIAEVMIFLISADCPSAAVAAEIIETHQYPVPIRSCVQQIPGMSPAVYEILQQIGNCSHLLIIGSDLEMDPLSVPALIQTAKAHPNAIVCASKFQKGAHRESYGGFHYLCNRAVNFAVERILHIRGTELISTFQVYPVSLCEKMKFTNPDRTFYEYTIRPLARGEEYIELPTNYKPRLQGASNFNPRKYIDLGVTFILTALDERKRLKAEAKAQKRREKNDRKQS